VVGGPHAKGMHARTRVVDGLVAFGVPPDRIVTVLNRATPTDPVGAADVVLGAIRQAHTIIGHRPLPKAYTGPLLAAYLGVLRRAGRGLDQPPALVPVTPGSLGVAALTAVGSTPRWPRADPPP
jgi:hypothetical protein